MGERKPLPKNASAPPRLRKIEGPRASSGVHVDRLIHERLRLAIVSALAVHDSLSFNELKRMIGTSDGNLSVHARKLEEAQYVACTKSFDGRTPRTEYRLTPAGRRSLERYLAHMEALIRAVRER
jgi:DNA-binding HxlR family transcriptional regulator